MTLRQSSDGGWYGTVPVILSRVVPADEYDSHPHTEYMIGHKAPYGGVSVSDEYKGVRFREEPVEWWEAQGFTVTVDGLLAKLKGWES